MVQERYVTYGDALKYFRRHTYLYNADWYGIVFCQSQISLVDCMEDTARIMDASSLDYSMSPVKRELMTLQGSKLKFIYMQQDENGERMAMDYLRGHYPKQIIFKDFEPSGAVLEACKVYLGRDLGDTKPEHHTIDFAMLKQ